MADFSRELRRPPDPGFRGLLEPDETNPEKLETWIRAARSADLPHVHSFAHGLKQDHDGVIPALTKPHHNGITEGVITSTKMHKRQMYGRAGLTLLGHRILLG